MADNENLNEVTLSETELSPDEPGMATDRNEESSSATDEAIEPVEVVRDLPVGKSLLGATLQANAAEAQEPDEEFETIPVQELLDVKLGRQGENDTQTVVIDCSAWLAKLPGCTFMIAATRPGEREIYLPEVTVENGVVTWPIMEQDTACAGTGRAEVRAMKDGKVKKSALFRTRIEPALEPGGSPDAPTPPNWVRLIIGSVEASQAAAEHAEELVDEATACAINAVRFDEDQELGDEQKATGRGNIDAASVAALVSRFAGRRVSIIGDSISTFTGYHPDGYNPAAYPNAGRGVTKVEETWWMKVIQASGAALEVNAAWNGSCASTARSSRGYPDFYDRRDALGDPELILVALGTNDSGENVALGEYDFETAYESLSEATFRTAYIKGVKALQANYPNAEIVLVAMAMGNSYADSIMTIGKTLGLRVIDVRGYHSTPAGNVHPDVIGMREIAVAVLHGTDASLSIGGLPADAAAVGTALAGKVAVQQGSGDAGKALVVGPDGNVTTGDAGIPDAVKVSLLNLVRHVAYIDDQGQAYYDALYAALYGGSGIYPRLVAVYAPGSHVVYTDDALDTLKPYLTVKRLENAQDSGTVVTDYTLSGTLVDGMSTVLVRKDGLATPVLVEAVDYNNIHEWSYPGNLVRLNRAASRHTVSESTVVPSYNDLSSPTRNVLAAERGLPGMDSVAYVTASGDIYQGPSGYYLIPVPVGCNTAVFTCDPSSYYGNLILWHYDGDNNWTRLRSNDYQLGPYTWNFSQYMTTGDTGYYMQIGIKFNSAGSAGEDIQGFTLTFEEA